MEVKGSLSEQMRKYRVSLRSKLYCFPTASTSLEELKFQELPDYARILSKTSNSDLGVDVPTASGMRMTQFELTPWASIRRLFVAAATRVVKRVVQRLKRSYNSASFSGGTARR
ncbi:hypothetical protein K0M31_010566 [Melipona bicolor]|uniref:Uncharacterized protein n=1 Tax=Melipona bicolor TaxID=60889 RepID=A0AA40FLE5_9HYME|nr:hypothetical protein K0M31_010566 [Melipona bicolor]